MVFKSNKKYAVVLSNGFTYNALSFREAERVYNFLCSAFPSYSVNLIISSM